MILLNSLFGEDTICYDTTLNLIKGKHQGLPTYSTLVLSVEKRPIKGHLLQNEFNSFLHALMYILRHYSEGWR
jgi:hypothetical protein